MTNALTNKPVTMSSREIAELTGKLHKNVMADIRKMLTELGYQPAEFSARYIDGKGESRECFNLPRVQGSSSSTIGFQGISEGRERALNTFSALRRW